MSTGSGLRGHRLAMWAGGKEAVGRCASPGPSIDPWGTPLEYASQAVCMRVSVSGVCVCMLTSSSSHCCRVLG